MKDILYFLSDLSNNNNREWFSAHKDRYQAVYSRFCDLTAQLITEISRFDDDVHYLTPQNCLFRIYRDTRFSTDKTPYKHNLGAYMARHGGKKSIYAGYYFHVEPGASMLSGGIYCPSSVVLRKLRYVLERDFNEFNKIISSSEFVDTFGEIYSPEKLKRVPMGYSPDSPAAEYLKYKHLTIEYPLTEEMLFAPDFVQRAADVYQKMQSLNHFLNEALDEEIIGY